MSAVSQAPLAAAQPSAQAPEQGKTREQQIAELVDQRVGELTPQFQDKIKVRWFFVPWDVSHAACRRIVRVVQVVVVSAFIALFYSLFLRGVSPSGLGDLLKLLGRQKLLLTVYAIVGFSVYDFCKRLNGEIEKIISPREDLFSSQRDFARGLISLEDVLTRFCLPELRVVINDDRRFLKVVYTALLNLENTDSQEGLNSRCVIANELREMNAIDFWQWRAVSMGCGLSPDLLGLA